MNRWLRPAAVGGVAAALLAGLIGGTMMLSHQAPATGAEGPASPPPIVTDEGTPTPATAGDSAPGGAPSGAAGAPAVTGAPAAQQQAPVQQQVPAQRQQRPAGQQQGQAVEVPPQQSTTGAPTTTTAVHPTPTRQQEVRPSPAPPLRTTTTTRCYTEDKLNEIPC
nr:hypothetical protein GCM10020241_47870 [Streptoalloteichus tenebrarius]